MHIIGHAHIKQNFEISTLSFLSVVFNIYFLFMCMCRCLSVLLWTMCWQETPEVRIWVRALLSRYRKLWVAMWLLFLSKSNYTNLWDSLHPCVWPEVGRFSFNQSWLLWSWVWPQSPNTHDSTMEVLELQAFATILHTFLKQKYLKLGWKGDLNGRISILTNCYHLKHPMFPWEQKLKD